MAQTKIKAGLFEGIIGNGTDGYFLMSNGDGTMTWSSVVINPTITDVDYPGTATAADPAGGETITLNGTGFKTGATVTVGGTSAPAVSYVSATQITFTTPAKAAGDYDIVVTNTDTGSATFINGISFNGIPAWTTAAGSLGTFASNTTISTITLQATEPDAGTITFNITNGALPTGLSLTGANIDGTTSILNADTLYTFTVTATDDENQVTPRTFTITVQKEFISSENFTINTYTGNGSTQSIEGKIGTAADFNGSSSRIDLNDDGIGASGTTRETFSVSLWVKITTATQSGIISDYISPNFGFAIQLETTGRLSAWNQYTGSNVSSTGTTAINDGSWHHLLLINNTSDNTQKLYIDNTLEIDQTLGTGTKTSSNIQVGYYNISGTPNYFFNGKIDQIRLFNKALSSSEVTTLYGESNTSTTKSTTDIFADGSGVALYEFEKGAIDTGGTSGYIGSGGVFNGSSSLITTPVNSDDVLGISMWIYFESGDTSNRPLGCNISSGNPQTYIEIGTNGVVAFSVKNTARYTAAGALGSTGWKHLYIDSIGNLYINGSSASVSSTTFTGTTNIDLIIGALKSNFGFFNSKIDQVRFFSRALTSSEVTTLYGETSASATKSTTDIFADGSGIALYELEGNANDTGGASGKFGSAAIFNGSSSYITLGATNQFASGTVSISFWVNPATISTNYVLLGNGNGGSFAEGDNDIFLRSDGYIGYELGQSSSIYEAKYSTTTQLTANTWNHITLTYDSSLGTNITQVYVNGVQQSLSATYAAGGTFSGDIFIGTLDYHIGKRNLSTLFFDGKIDDVRIYSDVLTSTEVGYLYNNTTASIPTDNLVAYYKLDGNSTDEQGSYDGVDTNVSYAYNGTATNVTYAYDGTPTNVSFVGTSFQPDLVWIKPRSIADNHNLFDSIRGTTKQLISNNTSAESTQVNTLTSFDSNGFTIGSDNNVNTNNATHVAWCWKAASSDSTNTDGSITSTVRANQDAGFSIVKYTGTLTSSGNISVGHGLSAAPELIISKRTDSTGSWRIRPFFLNNNPYDYLEFDTGALAQFSTSDGVMALPTSTTFDNNWNTALGGAGDVIAYCFHSVDGYQKIGSYTGTGATGNVINVGFKPRFLMWKKTNGAVGWFLLDGVRNTTDVWSARLEAHNANAEAGPDSYTVTVSDTGFEMTGSFATWTGSNELNSTYIYLAIA